LKKIFDHLGDVEDVIDYMNDAGLMVVDVESYLDIA